MNRDDFDRDPADSDEFFGELADMIELVDTMTQERLSGGELDRRREEIMNWVRRGAAAGPAAAGPAAVTPTAPSPRPALDAACRQLDGNNRLGVWTVGWPPPVSSPLRPSGAFDTSALAHLRPAAVRALADAERYRDSALSKAADIVKQAQQQADELRAEAQRILDDAKRAATLMATGSQRPVSAGGQADQGGSLTEPAGRPASSGTTRWSKISPGNADVRPWKTLLYEVGGGSLPGTSLASGLGQPRPDRDVLALLADVREAQRPVRLRVPFTYQSPLTSWLTRHGDAGADLLATGDDPAIAVVLWQCKSTTRPDGLSDQLLRRTTSRLWAEQWLWAGRLSLMRALLASAGGNLDHVTELAQMCFLGESDRLQRGRSAGSPNAQWSALLTSRTDRLWAHHLPELLQSVSTTSRLGGSLPILSPARRLLLACDVEGLGRADDGLRSRWQHAVRQILGDAASQIGLDSDHWQRQAAGDGELAILPVGTSWRMVLEQLLGAVDRELHEYNRYAVDAARLRLRVALHEGVVAAGAADGVAGQAAATVTRLVDAPPLKQALSAHPKASMAVAVSDPVYQDVTHGRDQYMRVTVPQTTKEAAEAAWVFVPDENVRFPDWTAPEVESVNDRWLGPVPQQRLQDEAQLTT